MKRPAPRPPKLATFDRAQTITTDELRRWPEIARWQREKLLTIRPIDRNTATVELTDKGREAAK